MISRYYCATHVCLFFFFFQAEDGIRDTSVTGVQTCALPILVVGIAANRNGVNALVSQQCVEVVVSGDIAAVPGAEFASIEFARRINRRDLRLKIGRASCRERGEISVVAVSLKKETSARKSNA